MMIRCNIYFPYSEGARFDFDYYINTHLPKNLEKLPGIVLEVSAEHGLSAPGGRPPVHIAIGHLRITSIVEYMSAFGTVAGELGADVPNFTDITGASMEFTQY